MRYTDDHMGSPPPTRWSSQKSKYQCRDHLVGIPHKNHLVVIAGEVVLAVSGMSIDGVGLQEVLGAPGVPTPGAREAVHLQKLLGVVAYSRQLALLL